MPSFSGCMTIDEVEAFRAAAVEAPEWALFFDLVIYHFLSHSQILNLEIDSIHLDGSHPQLEVPLSGVEGLIPVAPALVSALHQMSKEARMSGRRLLFSNFVRTDKAPVRAFSTIARSAELSPSLQLQSPKFTTEVIRKVEASPFQLLSILEHEGIRYLFNDYSLGGAMQLSTASLVMLGLQRSLQILKPIAGELKRILVVGGGAFTGPHYLSQICEGSIIDVCELDPRVCDLAREYFRLEPNPPFNIVLADANDFLRARDRLYDLIYVDVRLGSPLTFGASSSATEILDNAVRMLEPGGVLIYQQPTSGEFLRSRQGLIPPLANTSATIDVFEHDSNIASKMSFCITRGKPARTDALIQSASASVDRLSLLYQSRSN